MNKVLLHWALTTGLLLASGPLWAAKAGTRPDCNNNMVLAEVTPLSFGSFVADPALTGTVTIDPVTGRTASPGITLINSDAGAIGIIDVSFVPGYVADCSVYQINITLPASFTMSNAAGQTITVNNLKTDPPSGIGTVPPGGTLRVYIGGDATISPGLGGGVYSGTYSVDMVFR